MEKINTLQEWYDIHKEEYEEYLAEQINPISPVGSIGDKSRQNKEQEQNKNKNQQGNFGEVFNKMMKNTPNKSKVLDGNKLNPNIKNRLDAMKQKWSKVPGKDFKKENNATNIPKFPASNTLRKYSPILQKGQEPYQN